MTTPTLDKVLDMARRLSLDDQRRLCRLLNPPEAKTIEEMAAEQGVKPFNWDEVQSKATFWPEEESIDDFLEFLDESRGHRRREEDLNR